MTYSPPLSQGRVSIPKQSGSTREFSQWGSSLHCVVSLLLGIFALLATLSASVAFLGLQVSQLWPFLDLMVLCLILSALMASRRFAAWRARK